jgi:2'-hydroxyisoflavone reductase
VRILVLGGTAFLGRAIVEDALRTGAEVTLFTRGKTGTDLFPGLARLTGDRDTGDYASLREGSWDAVVDCSGYDSRPARCGPRAGAGARNPARSG